jgi:hypothetical protein
MVDASLSLADAIYRLGFLNLAESQTAMAWVSNAELYQFADDVAKKLSYSAGIFVTLDASIAVTAGIGVYGEPATHVFTIYAWITPLARLGGSIQALRPTTVGQLFALDNTWSTTSGEAKRFSLDAGAVGIITIYPLPINSGTLNQICQEFPPAIAAGSSQVTQMPTVLQDYLTYAMLAGARGKESDSALPEMAAHFQQRLSLYEQVIQHLWGAGV